MTQTKLFLIAFILLISGCEYEKRRQNYLQKEFPDHTVKPTEGILKKAGYDFILVDPDGKIYAADMLSEPLKIKIEHVGDNNTIHLIP
jgi:hypothetical protein